jgi:hypothetical protein
MKNGSFTKKQVLISVFPNSQQELGAINPTRYERLEFISKIPMPVVDVRGVHSLCRMWGRVLLRAAVF